MWIQNRLAFCFAYWIRDCFVEKWHLNQKGRIGNKIVKTTCTITQRPECIWHVWKNSKERFYCEKKKMCARQYWGWRDKLETNITRTWRTEWITWIPDRFKTDDDRFNNNRDIRMLLHLQLIYTLYHCLGKKKKKGYWKLWLCKKDLIIILSSIFILIEASSR